MKQAFLNDIPTVSFGPDDPAFKMIHAFHRQQMNQLFDMPSKISRPDNTPGRTYRHSMRVAQDVHDFARFIGLDEKTARHLQFATELHDIGKLDIPLDILDKPGKLTEQEFEEIKRHTDYGADRIRSSGIDHPIIDLAADIAFYHHERMDGKGYHNVTAEDIPSFVRLVKVCDIFDALSARRPYRSDREQMSPFDVMTAMITDDGFLYHEVDQEVTRAFITMKCHLLDTGLSRLEIEKLMRCVTFQKEKESTLARMLNRKDSA